MEESQGKNFTQTHKKSLLKVAGLLVSTLLALDVHAAQFVGLGDLHSGSNTYSSAWGISGDGTVVVGQGQIAVPTEFFPGYFYTEYAPTAFRWTLSSGMMALPMDLATDASYDGSVIVGNGTGGAYRWTQSAGLQNLGTLGIGAAVYGVSADGSVAVGFSDTASTREAFRWSEATGMQSLGGGRAEAVSADGNTVIGGGSTAFRWSPETGRMMMTNGPLDAPFYGYPNGVSADGMTIVGQGPEAWIWNEATGFNFLGFNQAAYAASGDGSIVVGGDQWSGGVGIAFIWDGTNGARNLKNLLQTEYGLDLTGWSLHAALDISDDGTKIVGVGVNPNGFTEAWYADIAPVPLPPAVWLLMSGISALFFVTGRKRKS